MTNKIDVDNFVEIVCKKQIDYYDADNKRYVIKQLKTNLQAFEDEIIDLKAELKNTFIDQSTATNTEKVKRFLQALIDGDNLNYFYGDGYPRQHQIKNDATQTLLEFNSLQKQITELKNDNANQT